ncbi:undecaprenyl-diphosphatase [Companilactobacillus hulinensis]|uniref:undecaprenyl-diphosphatase n=1 Tax=Companilactobacillus hulinensis TaxID=2486007 RepID=UPI000F7B4FD8|nr:undecaprenyl-diphosphatase [Companilactobacillus hulinensis]
MNQIDITIFRMINNMAGFSKISDDIGILFAKYLVYILALVMIYLWFSKRKDLQYRKMLTLSFISCVISEFVGKFIAGKIYFHLQPFAVLSNVHQLINKSVGNSFPSDHTIVFFSIMTIFFIYSKSKQRYWYLILATVVGLSRMFVGVHYPIDVFVGASIGTIISIITYEYLSTSKITNDIVIKIYKLENNIFKSRIDSN